MSSVLKRPYGEGWKFGFRGQLIYSVYYDHVKESALRTLYEKEPKLYSYFLSPFSIVYICIIDKVSVSKDIQRKLRK